ncbi:retrovirus-related gag-pol polyprotein [Elysia marginata]|uniref:Retrovirus-related gag-pol polyprotein n=1 Tax=Elysia marginata TaxID=1093978 RepID=A0AAV4IUU7_9GAST|nr:retrovirus-related gag-pol polyprotein [Elysia marginata]
MAEPTKNHMVAAKHVLSYLKATIDQKLTYVKTSNVENIKLVGACHADWGNCVDDRKSITGYGFRVTEGGSLISWKSKKQHTVSLSTCEAEYMSLCAASREGIFLTNLIKDIMSFESAEAAKDLEKFTLFCDNTGAIAMSKNPVCHQRSKHIDIRYHFIRDLVRNGIADIVYVLTNEYWSDIFTRGAQWRNRAGWGDEWIGLHWRSKQTNGPRSLLWSDNCQDFDTSRYHDFKSGDDTLGATEFCYSDNDHNTNKDAAAAAAAAAAADDDDEDDDDGGNDYD